MKKDTASGNGRLVRPVCKAQRHLEEGEEGGRKKKGGKAEMRCSVVIVQRLRWREREREREGEGRSEKGDEIASLSPSKFASFLSLSLSVCVCVCVSAHNHMLHKLNYFAPLRCRCCRCSLASQH